MDTRQKIFFAALAVQWFLDEFIICKGAFKYYVSMFMFSKNNPPSSTLPERITFLKFLLLGLESNLQLMDINILEGA